jgi:hypothetical protein
MRCRSRACTTCGRSGMCLSSPTRCGSPNKMRGVRVRRCGRRRRERSLSRPERRDPQGVGREDRAGL